MELKRIKSYLYQRRPPVSFEKPDESEVYKRIHKRELYAVLTELRGNPLDSYMYLSDDGELKFVQYEDEKDSGYWKDFLFPSEMTAGELWDEGARRYYGIYNIIEDFGDSDYCGVVLEPVRMEVRGIREPRE